MGDEREREIRRQSVINFFTALIRIGFVVFIVYMTLKYFAK